MTETDVYLVIEQKLEESELAWQNISVYADRSDAYEYAATVNGHFDVSVVQKPIIASSSEEPTQNYEDLPSFEISEIMNRISEPDDIEINRHPHEPDEEYIEGTRITRQNVTNCLEFNDTTVSEIAEGWDVSQREILNLLEPEDIELLKSAYLNEFNQSEEAGDE